METTQNKPFGISKDNFELIKKSREFILENLNNDPLQLALKGVDSSICTQIRYLSKCRTKLPNYYSVAAVIPPLSYEQSSSNLSVTSRGYSGVRCLDLTCGLGVDSYNFSKNFESVTTLERDSLLSEIAKYNFSLLECENIEVINCDSADYVKNYIGERFDMIFIDPARRNNNDKVFSFEQSSPNVIELLPALLKMSNRVVIKSSPMFDNNEAFEVFGGCVALKTVSVGGECRELMIDICNENKKLDTVSLINNYGHCNEYIFDNFPPSCCAEFQGDIATFKYILIPDVGFVKSRRVVDMYNNLLSKHTDIVYCGSVYLSENPIFDSAVRCFEILKSFEYKPKNILNYLKENKIKSATIIIKNFPYDINTIRKSLKLKEGSNITIIVTTIAGRESLFFVKNNCL